MLLLVSIILAIAPAILLVFYFYKRDSLKPEPAKMIVITFFVGIGSTIPAIILSLSLQFLENSSAVWISVFIQSFITAALVEELSKFLCFKIFLYRNKNFDEITDGIVYLATISLGFACFENILYSSGDIGIGLLRAVTAVPGHALWSGIMGYYIGLAKIREQGNTASIFTGLLIAVIYHGAYDFVLFAGINETLNEDFYWMPFLIIPLLVLMTVHIHRLLKKAKQLDQETPVPETV